MELEYHHLIVAAHMQLENVKVKDVSPHYFLFVFPSCPGKSQFKIAGQVIGLGEWCALQRGSLVITESMDP